MDAKLKLNAPRARGAGLEILPAQSGHRIQSWAEFHQELDQFFEGQEAYLTSLEVDERVISANQSDTPAIFPWFSRRQGAALRSGLRAY